jgi:hypothetical protein
LAFIVILFSQLRKYNKKNINSGFIQLLISIVINVLIIEC